MSYFVNKTDGTAIVVLDGTKDTSSTSLTLLGKLSSNYGENQNENFVRLLENFAFSTSPANPISGQLWYDTTNKILQIFDQIDNSWTSVGSKITGNIGTNGNLTLGLSQFEIRDTAGNIDIINNSINGNIALYSNIAGVKTKVLNVEGQTGLITVLGNSTNILGITTYSFVQNLVDNAIIQLNSALLTNVNSLNSNISSVSSNLQSLSSNVSSGAGSINAMEVLVNSNVAINNSGAGNTVINFKTPGGVSIISATGSSSLATPVTILGQWSLGVGSSLNANYADLAEFYTSDNDYEPGTVVSFGGEAEVTISNFQNDTRVAGVVSKNPAYVMNIGIQGTKTCVALQGKVPCNVIGPVVKGDLLTTSDVPGYAKKAENPVIGSIIGKSLENLVSPGPSTIEIVVGRM